MHFSGNRTVMVMVVVVALRRGNKGIFCRICRVGQLSWKIAATLGATISNEGGDVHDEDFGFDQFDRGNNVDDVLNHFPKVKYHCSNWQEWGPISICQFKGISDLQPIVWKHTWSSNHILTPRDELGAGQYCSQPKRGGGPAAQIQSLSSHKTHCLFPNSQNRLAGELKPRHHRHQDSGWPGWAPNIG